MESRENFVENIIFAVRFPGRTYLSFGTVVLGFVLLSWGGQQVAQSPEYSLVVVTVARTVDLFFWLGWMSLLVGYPLVVARAALTGEHRPPTPWFGSPRDVAYRLGLVFGEGFLVLMAFIPYWVVVGSPLAFVDTGGPLVVGAVAAVSIGVFFSMPAAALVIAAAPLEDVDRVIDPGWDNEPLGGTDFSLLSWSARMGILERALKAYDVGRILEIALTREYLRVWAIMLPVLTLEVGIFYLATGVVREFGGVERAGLRVALLYLGCAGLLVAWAGAGRAYRDITAGEGSGDGSPP